MCANKFLTGLAFIAAVNILHPILLTAQTNLSINNISKIILVDKAGGMGGSVTATYHIIKKRGNWVSEQTGLNENLMTGYARLHKQHNFADSNVYIKNIKEAAINQLLFSISHPVRHFSPSIFGITATYMQAHVDSFWRGNLSNLTVAQKRIFVHEITQPRVDSGIILEHRSFAMDSFVQSSMEIVKTNGDTIHMVTQGQNLFLLPWLIGKRDSAYNVGISKFFASATIKTPHDRNNKTGIEGGYVYDDIYESIYRRYSEKSFTHTYFASKFPQAFSLLKTKYDITDITTSDILNAVDPLVFIILHPKNLPSNIYVKSALRVKNMDMVKQVTLFADRVGLLLKKNNFLFKYAANVAAGDLHFELPDSTSLFPNNQFEYPYLKNFSPDDVIDLFYASKNNKDESSQWYYLPDGTMLLHYYEGPAVLGIPRESINPGSNPTWPLMVMVLFGANGKIVNNYSK